MIPFLSEPKESRVAYVGSTLPIGILNKKITSWNVTHVILSDKSLFKSYAHLKDKHPQISIIKPYHSYFHFLQLIFLMVRTHFSHTKIIFFHECCLTMFDILVKIIQPNGDFYPQVTMNGFQKANNSFSQLSISTRTILHFFFMQKSFYYYKGYKDNDEGKFIVLTLKNYPPSIKSHSVFESKRIASKSYRPKKNNKKIIFLAGRDAMPDRDLIKIYSDMIDLANKFNYKCYIKDHPSDIARLNMTHRFAENMDSSLPVELLKNDFAFAVGVSSTSLLHFKTRAISILNLVTSDKKKLKYRKSHLVSLSEGKGIIFLNSLNKFKEIISSRNPNNF